MGKAGTKPTRSQPYRIDVHHHILPPEYVSTLKGIGITGTIGVQFPEWTPKKSLNFMDKNGIATAITSVSTPGVNLKDGSFSHDLARLCNEHSAQLISDYPDRFGAFAVLPLFDMMDALRELEYAIDKLNLDGVALLTHVQGTYLGDPKYDELFAELNRRQMVVHLHPTDPPFGNIPNLKFPNALIEAPFDTTRAVTNMIHNGIMDRCPNIRFILSHGGGATPFLAWKIALLEYKQTHKSLRVKAAYDFLLSKRGPFAGINILNRLYYDTALAANPYVLRSLQEVVDSSHILFGTDYVWAQSWMTPLFVKALREYDGFDEQALALVERESALELFPRFRGGDEHYHLRCKFKS